VTLERNIKTPDFSKYKQPEKQKKGLLNYLDEDGERLNWWCGQCGKKVEEGDQIHQVNGREGCPTCGRVLRRGSRNGMNRNKDVWRL